MVRIVGRLEKEKGLEKIFKPIADITRKTIKDCRIVENERISCIYIGYPNHDICVLVNYGKIYVSDKRHLERAEALVKKFERYTGPKWTIVQEDIQ